MLQLRHALDVIELAWQSLSEWIADHEQAIEPGYDGLPRSKSGTL